MRSILFLVFLLFLTSVAATVTVTLGTDCSTPVIGTLAYTQTCTINVAVDDNALVNGAVLQSDYLIGLKTSSSSCTLVSSTGELTVIVATGGTTSCQLAVDDSAQTPVFYALESTISQFKLPSNTMIDFAPVTIPTKSYDPDFITMGSDCKTTATTCSMILHFQTVRSSQVTFRGTNFKIQQGLASTTSSVDFSMLPSVSSTTIHLIQGQQSISAVQFNKAVEPGCVPVAFSLHMSESFNSVSTININTGLESCNPIIKPTFDADCMDPQRPYCSFVMPYDQRIGANVVIANMFTAQPHTNPSLPDRPPFLPIIASRTNCATISGDDLKITYANQQACSFKLHKPDMDVTHPVQFSLLITSTDSQDLSVKSTPISINRKFTEAIAEAKFEENCLNPVVPTCTYKFYANWTPHLTISISDPEVYGYTDATTTTIDCQGYVSGTATGVGIDFVPTARLIAGGEVESGVTCTITFSLPLRRTIPLNTGPYFFFSVSIEDAVTVATPETTIYLDERHGYPAQFAFDPISSVVVSPSCAKPEIHLCTVSFTHPRPLEEDFPLEIKVAQTPAADLVSLAIRSAAIADDSTRVSADGSSATWTLVSTSALSFSTLTFIKGPISSPGPFSFRLSRAGSVVVPDEPVLEEVNAANPIRSVFDVQHSGYFHSSSDCMDPLSPLCTVTHQSFSTDLRIKMEDGAGTDYVSIVAARGEEGQATPSVVVDGNDPTLLFITGLPIMGEIVSITFSAPLGANSIELTPALTVGGLDYSFTQDIEFQYNTDAIFSPQGDCADLNKQLCTILISFSNLNIDLNGDFIVFDLPVGYKLEVATQVGICTALGVTMVPANDKNTFTISKIAETSVASMTCPLIIKKPYSIADVEAVVTTLSNIPSQNIKRPLVILFQPIMLWPSEECYTFPKTGDQFRCNLVLGFMGSSVEGFSTSFEPADYNWFQFTQMKCDGALGWTVTELERTHDPTATPQDAISLLVPNAQPINMITFCRASFTTTTPPSNFGDFTSSWTLKTTATADSTFDLTFPAPPTKSPVAFDNSVANQITITLDETGIESFEMLDDSFLLLDGLIANTCGTLLTIADRTFTVVDASYAVGASCVWSFVPTARTPINDEVKHQITFVSSPSLFTHLAYPELKRVFQIAPLTATQSCISLENCPYQVSIEASTTSTFVSATIANPFNWVASTSPINCLDATKAVVATLSPIEPLAGSSVVTDLKFLALAEITDDVQCTLDIPVAIATEAQWADVVVDTKESGTAATAEYQLYFIKQTPVEYVSLIPTHCAVGEKCIWSFMINPTYLPLRPLLSFQSPFTGYWEAMNGNYCELSQVGMTVYLRVVRGVESFTAFGLDPICSIAITPTIPYSNDQLTVQRYHLSGADIQANNLYGAEQYAPIDLSRYTQQLAVIIKTIKVSPVPISTTAATQPLSISTFPTRPCVAGQDAICPIVFTINEAGIKTVRITNFMSFSSLVDTAVCVTSQGPATFRPSVDLKYMYFTLDSGEVFQKGASCLLERVVTETRSAIEQEHAYEFEGILTNTNDVTTTTYLSAHKVTYPSYSPYGFYIPHVAQEAPNAYMVEGAENSWVRFVAARPGDETTSRLVQYKSLNIQFVPVPADPTKSDQTVFTQLFCVPLARETDGIRPSCTASVGINGDPTLVTVTFSDNANTETIEGFYLTFKSMRLPSIVAAIQQNVITFNDNHDALRQTIVFSQVIRVGGNSLLTPLSAPSTFTLKAWPGEYDIGEAVTDHENTFIFNSEVDAAIAVGNDISGTPIRIQMSGLFPEGSFLEVMLYTINSNGLIRPMNIEQYGALISPSNSAVPLDAFRNRDCERCLSYRPTGSTSLPLSLDFTIKTRLKEKISSFSATLNASRVFLRLAVKVPINPTPLPFAVTPLQRELANPGNHGSTQTNDQSAESIIRTIVSWSTKANQVHTIHSSTKSTISNPSAISSIAFPDGMFTGSEYHLNLTPLPEISHFAASEDTVPATAEGRVQFVQAKTFSISREYYLGCDINYNYIKPNGFQLTASLIKNTPASFTKLSLTTVNTVILAKLTAPTELTYQQTCSVHVITTIVRTKEGSTTPLPGVFGTRIFVNTNTFQRIPFMPPQYLASPHQSTTCGTTDRPVFYASGANSATTNDITNLSSWTTFTLTLPNVYTIQPVSTTNYSIRVVSESITDNNIYTVFVAPGNVYAIHTIWSCPGPDVVDASSQSISWRASGNPSTRYLDVSNGYFIYVPLSRLNSVYIVNAPGDVTYNPDFAFAISMSFYASIYAIQDLIIYTPPSSHHQLFKVAYDPGSNFHYDFFPDSGGTTVSMMIDENDPTRMLISSDRDIYHYEKTRWDKLITPIPFDLPLATYSPYYNNLLSRLCFNNICSNTDFISFKVIPQLELEWRLRLEEGTNVPSSITLNQELLLQHRLVLTWTEDQFSSITTDLIEYPTYTYQITSQLVSGKIVYTATLAFSRYNPANAPIDFPLFYKPSATKTGLGPVTIELTIHPPDVLDADGNVIPAAAPTVYPLTSDEFTTTTLPTAPLYDFAYTPEFRSGSIITFSFKLGRPLLFGQQLTFSELPLAPSLSATISFNSVTMVQVTGTKVVLDNGELGTDDLVIPVNQLFQFVAQTSAASWYQNCSSCVTLTVATTSSLPIPAGTEIKFTLAAATLASQVVQFNEISVSSSGFGLDELVLEPFVLSSRTASNTFPLFSPVLTGIAPTAVSTTQYGLKTPVCKIDTVCDLTVTFTQSSFTRVPKALLATLDFIGYKLNVQYLPKPSISIVGASISLYSFSDTQIIVLIRGDALDTLKTFSFSALFTEPNLNGYVSLVLRNLNGYSDPSVPNFYHSTNVLGPQIHPDQVNASFFHVYGGAFVGEPVSFAFVPGSTYSRGSSSSSPFNPGSIKFYFDTTLGGLYQYPALEGTSTAYNVFAVDPKAVHTTNAIGSFLFKENSPEAIAASPTALPNLSASTESTITYFAAYEPLVVKSSALKWKNEFEPRALQGAAFDLLSAEVPAIAYSAVPFLRVRGIRAVRVVPQLAVIDVDQPTTFTLSIYEDFLDSVRFLPEDRVIIRIPAIYEILSTSTVCQVINSNTKTEPKGFYATLTDLKTIDADTGMRELRLSIVKTADWVDQTSSATRELDPEYHCPLMVQVPAAKVDFDELNSETPYSTLTFTAASLDSTSSFPFFMPYPVRLPKYSLTFVGFDTLDVPGQLWFSIENAYFTPTFKLQFKLPFGMNLASSDSYICRTSDSDSPVASILYLSATYELIFSVHSFYSAPSLLCRLSMVPTTLYNHQPTETWQAYLTTGMSTQPPVPLHITWIQSQLDQTKIDYENALPSYAIAPPSPLITIEGDIVMGLTSSITLTGEHMVLQPGDNISFSIGVEFSHFLGKKVDISGLQCLSNSNLPFATVGFQFAGDSTAGTMPSEDALPEGKSGVGNRIQLSPLYSTPSSTPWRCTIQLKPLSEYVGRIPDAILSGISYPNPVAINVVNELAFRSTFNFALGLSSAMNLGTTVGSFDFYYNSTDVRLVHNAPTANVQIELPTSFIATPIDGLSCQLNYATTINIPFYITASSSVTTSFLIPVDRLVVPTANRINYVQCKFPSLAARGSFETDRSLFSFKNNLIQAPTEIPAIIGTTVEWQNPDPSTQASGTWTTVAMNSNQAVEVIPGEPVLLRLTLTNWPRVTPLYPTLPPGFELSNACFNIDTWDQTVTPLPVVLFKSNTTNAWVTIYDEVNTSCIMQLKAPAVAGDYQIPILIGSSPNNSASILRVKVLPTPRCFPLDLQAVTPMDKDGHWTLTYAETQALKALYPRPDMVGLRYIATPIPQTGSLGNIRMQCVNFPAQSTPSITTNFIKNPTSERFLSELAPVYDPTTNPLAINQLSVGFATPSGSMVPGFTSLFKNVLAPVETTTACGPTNPTCSGVAKFTRNPLGDVLMNGNVPFSIVPNIGASGSFIINYAVALTTPADYASSFVTTTPYEVDFSVSADSVTAGPFKYFLDLSLVPIKPIPDPRLPDSFVAITNLDVSLVPRGKVSNFLLTAQNLPYGEIFGAAIWKLGDPDFDATKTVYDYFMSPMKLAMSNPLDGAPMSPVACYDPNNVGTGVFANVVLGLKTVGADTYVTFMVQPDAKAIRTAVPASNGLSFNCVFPILVVAPEKVSFTAIDPATTAYTDNYLTQFPAIMYRYVAPVGGIMPIKTTFIRPNFAAMFNTTFVQPTDIKTEATISGTIKQTGDTGFITLSIQGTRVYPGDTVVIQFKPTVDETFDSRYPADEYFFFAPPAATRPTPCYNLFYPTSQEVVGFLTALTPNLNRQLGLPSNTMVLDVISGRAGEFQELVCTAPFTTFASVDHRGGIFGRVYKPHEFALLQLSSRTTMYQFTTDFRPQLLNTSGILYWLPNIGTIGEPISKNLYLAAYPTHKFSRNPSTNVNVRFVMSSTPPRHNMTMVADFRDYRPAGLIKCTDNAKNIRFYGEANVSDETRNLLRIYVGTITESDIEIECVFLSPDSTPPVYYGTNFVADDGWYSFESKVYPDEAARNARPPIAIPVSIYNTSDLTAGGLPVSDTIEPVVSATLDLQSTLEDSQPGFLLQLFFLRPRSNAYIDGTERTQFLTGIARAFGKRISKDYNLYTLFKGPDLALTAQIVYDGANNLLAKSAEERLNYVTLMITVSFPDILTADQLVAPYQEAGIYDAVKAYGADQERTLQAMKRAYPSIIFEKCRTTCGGSCEPCPIGDKCTNDAQCRVGLKCFTLVEQNAGIAAESHCISQADYDAAKLRLAGAYVPLTFQISTSNNDLIAQAPAATDSNVNAAMDNAGFMLFIVIAIIGFIF